MFRSSDNRRIFYLMATAAFIFSAPYSQGQAAGKGSNPNGVPFLQLNSQMSELQEKTSTLQDQIDSLVAHVDTIEERISADEAAIASLQQQNAQLQAMSDLGADLQNQMADNNNIIQNLQEDIANIQQLLSMKQMIISGSCPTGQAIRQVNSDGSVVCVVPGGASGIELVVVYQYNYANPLTSNYVTASCPAGYSMSGGGFYAYGQDVFSSHGNTAPWNNTWTVQAQNPENSLSYLYAYANCIKLVP
jgi:multidrug efflux pump subunit AcrA (membrane-fusion protein)